MAESNPVSGICTREFSKVLEARKSEMKCRTQIDPWDRVGRNEVEKLRINIVIRPLSQQ
jgi:hypothetical protein